MSARFSRLFAALVLAAALLVGPHPQASGQGLTTISVAAPPSEDVAPILYALNSGMFAKAGLNVVLQQLASGAVIASAVAGGASNIGFSSLSGLISGHVRGVPFELIAPGGQYTPDDPYAYMVVRADSPIHTARDLVGKTVGSPALKDLDWVASSAWIDQNGGDSKASKFIELPNPALLPALLEGRIDTFSLGEPWIAGALESGKTRILAKSFEAIAPRFLMTAWFSTSDYIAKNRDAVERFERVMRDASVYTNAHHAEIVPLLATFTKLDPGLISRTIKGAAGTYLDAKQIQPMIDVSAKYGLIDKTFGADEIISSTALKPGR